MRIKSVIALLIVLSAISHLIHRYQLDQLRAEVKQLQRYDQCLAEANNTNKLIYLRKEDEDRFDFHQRADRGFGQPQLPQIAALPGEPDDVISHDKPESLADHWRRKYKEGERAD